MRLPEYDDLDALGLAERIARGDFTAAEALAAALERCDARNPPLNAVVERSDDEARQVARRLDGSRGTGPAGPLHGVPFLLKGLSTAWRGHPLTGASRLGAGFVPDFDAEATRRLHGAGLVLFGLTNSPELGILAHTEPALTGPTRNPWDLGRTPGGSSGGSGAAVAARMVPAAHGNDGGGSIRIPASHCGLVGLKPSRGRVSMAPVGEVWSGFSSEGVLTRTVRDSAALLDVLAGPVPGDPDALPPPARPFLAEVGTPPGRLRIAFTDGPFFGHATHADCAAAVREAAALLGDLGHEVVEARPPFEREPLVRAYLVVVAAGVALAVGQLARRTGRRPGPSTLEAETLGLLAAGRAFSAAEHAEALETIRAFGRSMAAFHARHDLLLTPTVAQPPTRVGALAPKPWERAALLAAFRLGSRRLLDLLFAQIGDRSFDATGYTMPWNQTGQPAVSLPFRWTADGLPIGVQAVGRFGDEATLFRLAAQLEAARPWAQRRPPGV